MAGRYPFYIVLYVLAILRQLMPYAIYSPRGVPSILNMYMHSNIVYGTLLAYVMNVYTHTLVVCLHSMLI